MKQFTFHLPTRIVFGRGGLSKIGLEASKFGDKCLLVTGRSFARRSGYLNIVAKSLKESGVNVVVFDQVEPNPSIETVYRGFDEGKKGGCDLVIALGGGSAMDAAKGIAFLLKSNAKLEDNFAPNEVEEALPVIAIPSTCGTGSEVTKYAVITNVSKRRKEVLLGDTLIPRIAFLDADVLNKLPKELVAYTGFDALSHALEAYISKDSTPLSDLLALEAAHIILGSILEAYNGSSEGRERMLYASMLAGVAINCAGTEIVHAIGYYLTNYHNVHHGLANGMILPHVLRLELRKGLGKLEEAASKLGFENGMRIIEKIKEISDKTNLPKSLRELGVKEFELDAMVSDALSYARNVNRHPFPITPEDLKNLCLTAFVGRDSTTCSV
jgi:alcohol dehydrogenase class IV